MRRAVTLQPEFAEAHLAQGQILLREGKLDEAAAALQTTLKLRPDDAEAHYTLGNVWQRKGETEAAIVEYQTAIKLAPGNPETHNALGAVLRRKGEAEAAQAEFREAQRLLKLKSDRNLAIAATDNGVRRFNEGQLDGAVERFEAAIKLDPHYAPAYYHLSLALRKKGRAAAAQEARRKAEQLDPKLKRQAK